MGIELSSTALFPTINNLYPNGSPPSPQNKRHPHLAKTQTHAHRKSYVTEFKSLKEAYSFACSKQQLNIQSKENDMKARTLLLTAALCLTGTALGLAQGPQMGTWKLNEAKSTIPAGLAKNSTVVYTAVGGNIKVTTDGTAGDGKPSHTEWTGKFDGKDYPLTGDSTADSRSYKTIDDHTLELTNKKNGKVTTSGRVVVSADGKTRTLHLSATDPSGKKLSGVSVYNKQ